jgi:hypothetical protein
MAKLENLIAALVKHDAERDGNIHPLHLRASAQVWAE